MYRTTLQWRTSPRSINVLVERLQSFYQEIYNQSKSPQELYNYKELNPYYPKLSKPKYIHPYRRRIIYDMIKRGLNDGTLQPNATNYFVSIITKDDFAKGIQMPGDRADKESIIRQVATTAQQFGFMDSQTARLTSMGEKICKNNLLPDDLISQLLKMYIVTNSGEEGVFPFETFLKLMDEFHYLSIQEMMFIFGVIHRSDLNLARYAIKDFRNVYLNRDYVPNRNDIKTVNRLLIKVWNRYFPPIDDFYMISEPRAYRKAKGNFNSLVHDYPDAFKNTLVGTGIFTTTGYGQYKTIRIREWNRYKFHELLTEYNFDYSLRFLSNNISSRNNLSWFGADNIQLPWVNPQAIRERIRYRLAYLDQYHLVSSTDSKEYHQQYQQVHTTSELQRLDQCLDNVAKHSNWFQYAKNAPYDTNTQQNILEIYKQISNKSLDEGKPALWLENNTWKAMFSIGSRKNDLIVHYNGKSDPDLKPQSFAKGGQPDIIIEFDNTIIIIEVSLMTGVEQWEHEGSSVISHLDQITQHSNNKKVEGLFLVDQINFRSWWQFFILNKSSWLGQPLPVAPITVNQFYKILQSIYKRHLDIHEFEKLVNSIIQDAYYTKNYQIWKNNVPQIIKDWK